MSDTLTIPSASAAALAAIVLGITAKQFNGEPDLTKSGVQKYSVRAVLDGGNGDVVTVTVPMVEVPSFTFGQQVVFTGLRIGSTPKGLWLSAAAVEPKQATR
ncbi:MAG: hypothetical protein KKE65_08715 [Actinobacteria bacterium]|jgi:hypothetical protein|nr:hypothetical protein [Actinomycetota bacterium]